LFQILLLRFLVGKCAVCPEFINRHLVNSHHKIKRASGGQDGELNETLICTRCHSLLHKGEALVKRGKSDEVILDFYQAILVNFPGFPVNEVSHKLLELAKIAAKEAPDSAVRKIIPMEVRVPIELHKKFTSISKDLHVSRNDLILWAMKEVTEGRVILPNR